jgi:hypothetical protein
MLEIETSDVMDYLKGRPTDSVRLTIGSPPYPTKGRRYRGGSGEKLITIDWVQWMLMLTREAVRVTDGDVIWVVNNSMVNGVYEPAVEGLVWLWWQEGGQNDRTCVWHKNAPPNRPNWFGNDWEFVLCFRKDNSKDRKVWNWEAVGHEKKFSSGGHFRQRDAKGERRRGGDYPQGKLARPRDVIRALVGGGHMGSKLAHLNEAPYPESIVEPFVLALTNPGDIVCDPFLGSGTTAAVALKNGRGFMGCDSRESQVELARRRLAPLLSVKEIAMRDHLLEEMHERGWEVGDLAARSGLAEKRTRAILDGDRVTAAEAESLGTAFGVHPQLFLNLQAA